MAGSNDWEGQLKEDVGQDAEVYNTKDPDEVFLTNRSRLELALRDYKDGIKPINSWINPFILFVTVIPILLVGSFTQTFGIPESVWNNLYLTIAIFSVGWLIYTVINIIQESQKADIKYVIEELKGENE